MIQSEQPTKKSGFDLDPATPSLSDVSSATASSHTALLVMVVHAGSASSQVSPPEENSLNHTVAVGAAVVGSVDGAAVGAALGLDGVGTVDGAAVGASVGNAVGFTH